MFELEWKRDLFLQLGQEWMFSRHLEFTGAAAQRLYALREFVEQGLAEEMPPEGRGGLSSTPRFRLTLAGLDAQTELRLTLIAPLGPLSDEDQKRLGICPDCHQMKVLKVHFSMRPRSNSGYRCVPCAEKILGPAIVKMLRDEGSWDHKES